MDPNLIHLDYEKLFEVLITIVIFSFFVERALSVVFEMRWLMVSHNEMQIPGYILTGAERPQSNCLRTSWAS